MKKPPVRNYKIFKEFQNMKLKGYQPIFDQFSLERVFQ